MIPDLPFVKSAFNRFNDLCFDGKLPYVPFVLTRAGSFLGKMEYSYKRSFFGRITGHDNFRMRISISFDLPEDEWEDVVIHEMIHYWIAYNNLKDNSAHGRLFRRMMDSINNDFNRHITVRRNDLKLYRPSRHHSIHYVCVSEMKDGYGVTVCSEAMAKRLRGPLKLMFPVKSSTWYCSDDSFWDRFPRARTPRIYRISKEELDGHLWKNL